MGLRPEDLNASAASAALDVHARSPSPTSLDLSALQTIVTLRGQFAPETDAREASTFGLARDPAAARLGFTRQQWVQARGSVVPLAHLLYGSGRLRALGFSPAECAKVACAHVPQRYVNFVTLAETMVSRGWCVEALANVYCRPQGPDALEAFAQLTPTWHAAFVPARLAAHFHVDAYGARSQLLVMSHLTMLSAGFTVEQCLQLAYSYARADLLRHVTHLLAALVARGLTREECVGGALLHGNDASCWLTWARARLKSLPGAGAQGDAFEA